MTTATSGREQADRALAQTWALLDRAEHQVRAEVRAKAGLCLPLLAANAIARARDALEAIHPAAPFAAGLDALPGGTCQDLVRAAAGQLASIPAGHEPRGLPLALDHLGVAELEGGGWGSS
jgi:hypothetical protein